jgi:hypothetical protein
MEECTSPSSAGRAAKEFPRAQRLMLLSDTASVESEDEDDLVLQRDLD